MKKLLIITFLIIYSCSSSDDGYVTPSVVVQPPLDTTEPVTVQHINCNFRLGWFSVINWGYI